jgi:lipoate-protein ligase B
VSRRLLVLELGRRPYEEVLDLQRALCRERMAGRRREDLLLLVEHDPVVTLGRSTRPTSLPVPPPALRARGIPVVEVERGGDVTYHAPGQLVGYPILHLSEHREDLHWYLRALEGALIDALAGLGIQADRVPGLTGVWTGNRKIASIGIHVKQWVTYHGFALNVTTDLGGFGMIVPCGIEGVVMTSVAGELGGADRSALWEATRTRVVQAFAGGFGFAEVELAQEVDPLTPAPQPG